MINVILWKWRKNGYRSTFDHDTINTYLRMADRSIRVPHRIVCVTDDPKGIDGAVSIVDIRTLPSYVWMNVRNPSSPVNPSCYVRLAIYHPDAVALFGLVGDRIVSSDVDAVLIDDATSLFDRAEDFAIWGGQSVQPGRPQVYNWFNGSFQALRAGARPQVWTRFDPRVSPQRAHAAGCRGSDQGWIAHCLGRQEKLLTIGDGICSYRNHVLPAGGRLPAGAKFVAFHGRHDPWHNDVHRAHDWVREHYR